MTSPVLLLTFNRLETVQRVFAAVRDARPPRLYLASDGPRASHPEDADKIRRVRDFLQSRVDWPCEVFTLFQERNLGCKEAPIAGIRWLFEHEEEGVILEDDCLPHPDFFPFCDEILERFRDDERICAISGTNIQKHWDVPDSYFLSLMGGNWGWASWRRAWAHYRADITPEFTAASWKRLEEVLHGRRGARILRNLFLGSAESMKSDAWDYQWFFRRLMMNGLTVVPKDNLICNIGVGEDATHTDRSNLFMEMETSKMSWPLRHPSEVAADRKFDSLYLETFHRGIGKRLMRRIRGILHV